KFEYVGRWRRSVVFIYRRFFRVSRVEDRYRKAAISSKVRCVVRQLQLRRAARGFARARTSLITTKDTKSTKFFGGHSEFSSWPSCSSWLNQVDEFAVA